MSKARIHAAPRTAAPGVLPEQDPLWYQHAVVYELHVRAFQDSAGDGIGDFAGLTSRLDYLQDLGVTAIWLLPFYPSPLRDDGYDIADYSGVNPAYGTLRDARRFIAEAHARGLRVITELVINHTSDQHPWFQRARRSPPGSRWRDFYVWSDAPDAYPEARIIFKDFETSNWAWDPVARSHYWHRFYSHQPDLNFDNPLVHRAIEQVVESWLAAGVDGMRLDAIPYLYEREGTNCENLPETHAYLKKLRRFIDERFPGRILLAEANQWPEDSVAYFGDGDECHMAFHFPLMPRLFMAIRMEDSYPIADILQQTPPTPANAQWALFLRNHDELTLEMVTDEERDYMYRVYANDRQARINLGIRRRLAPLLGNNRRKIELMNGLLFSLPGTPVIYYGDEIGMGDNVYLGDRNGVRTPMQWTGDRNAGFSRANPQQLFLPVIIDPEYHYETLNVEAQQNNPHSMLWWMKRLIALRRRHRVFGEGTLEMLSPGNPRVLAFVRRLGDDRILVVANLSRFVQCVEIDLSAYRPRRPVELFGGAQFPPIGDQPYFLSLGPHSFYWFDLRPAEDHPSRAEPPAREAPSFAMRDGLESGLRSRSGRAAVESALALAMPLRRWFGAKARTIRSVRLTDAVPIRVDLPEDELAAALALVRVEFTEGEPDLYALPLALASAERAARIIGDSPGAVIAHVHAGPDRAGRVLYDGLEDPAYSGALLEAVERRRRFKGAAGELVCAPTRSMRRPRAPQEREPTLSAADQSNSSVIFGDAYIMKLYRRVEAGANPDLEVGRYLTETANFPHTPSIAGAIEYTGAGSPEPLTIASFQVFVPNQGDAWRYTTDQLVVYCERVLASQVPAETFRAELSARSMLLDSENEPPEPAWELIGPYLESAELLGRRTAELHIALASSTEDPAFAPEPFTQLYLRGLYQSMRTTSRRALDLLRKRLDIIDPADASLARHVLDREHDILAIFQSVSARRLSGQRIRCHGDYHLGQVLYTGRDFAIIDFEGEPARPLGERKLKRSPLRDVAGMLRSFQYAAHTSLREQVERGTVAGREPLLEQAVRFWAAWSSAKFLAGYMRAAAHAPFMPRDREEVRLLLDVWLLEKAVYELHYELNNRPRWVAIPLRGIAELLGLSRPDQTEPPAPA